MIKQFLAASLLLLAMTACGNQKPPDNALHPTAAVEEGTTGIPLTQESQRSWATPSSGTMGG